MPNERSEGRWPGRLLLALSVTLFAAVPPAALHYWGWKPVWAWGVTLVVWLLIVKAIGVVSGEQILTDERRRWSLARFQLLAWTWLLLPTVWTMTLVRLFGGAADPVALEIDENLWALVGISAASFVGSRVILAGKARTPGLLDRATGEPEATGGARDLFRGEEASNADVVDIGRVQMAFFTGVALCVYLAACWHVLVSGRADAMTFPAMSDSLVALVGISHATYLANKAAPHTKEQTS